MSRQNNYNFESRLNISPKTLQFLNFIEFNEVVVAHTNEHVEFDLTVIDFNDGDEKFRIRAVKKTGVSEAYHTNDIIAETKNQYVIKYSKCINS